MLSWGEFVVYASLAAALFSGAVFAYLNPRD
jgi:hypothetical protein